MMLMIPSLSLLNCCMFLAFIRNTLKTGNLWWSKLGDIWLLRFGQSLSTRYCGSDEYHLDKLLGYLSA